MPFVGLGDLSRRSGDKRPCAGDMDGELAITVSLVTLATVLDRLSTAVTFGSTSVFDDD